MEQQKQDLKEWAKATRNAKIMELEAAMRFILRNQPFVAFWNAEDGKPLEAGKRNTQGRMFLVQDDEPRLEVNWDEVNVFDDQKELFQEMFEGDFTSDKLAIITGVKL